VLDYQLADSRITEFHLNAVRKNPAADKENTNGNRSAAA